MVDTPGPRRPAPRRIERKARKGWRLPANAVYVGRGSKWGNPFPFDHQVYLGKDWARAAYDHWLHTSLKGMALLREHLHELKGKDLVCWCRDGVPCHADVLLALANDDEQTTATSESAVTQEEPRPPTSAAASHR